MLSSRRTLLVSAVLVVCWSSGFVGAELASRTAASPITVLAWRFGALALLLLGVSARYGGGALRRGAAWKRQASVAALSQVVYLGLVFTGVGLGVPGGTASLLAALQPLLVATVALPLLGERTSARQWAGLVVGLVGVVLVVAGDLGVADAPGWAYLLPLAAMLSLAGGTLLERRLAPPESLLDAVTIQACVTAVGFTVLALATGSVAPPAEALFWGAVVWLVLLSSIGGYGSYVLLTRWRGATYVSALLYLTPPTTMLWVFVMFGEPVPLLGLVGLAVTAAGVAFYGAHGSREPSARPTR